MNRDEQGLRDTFRMMSTTFFCPHCKEEIRFELMGTKKANIKLDIPQIYKEE